MVGSLYPAIPVCFLRRSKQEQASQPAEGLIGELLCRSAAIIANESFRQGALNNSQEGLRLFNSHSCMSELFVCMC